VHQTFPSGTDVPARRAKWTITDLPSWLCGFAIPIARSARTFRPAAVPVAVRSAAPIRARYQIPW
jgi:hypothetical protein